MSKCRDNLLMWAHYADFHRGICLGFDTNNEMFGKAFKIEYSQDYPKTKFFTDSNWDRAKSQLLTKAKCWEYEQEWRLIDHVTGAGVKQFPKKALVYVIMGCEIIDENEKKIVEWRKKYKPDIKCYKAIKKYNKFELQFTIV